MAQELKYYHGEKENPYNEVNDQQGLWCERYNEVAAMLWDFEYHWANGWDKYSKLVGHNAALYFEKHKQPQKDFKTIQEALQAFAMYIYSQPLYLGSPRWVKHIYDNAMQERFYKPQYNIVPAADIPGYLHWYKGESANPYTHEPATSTKRFWWEFEQGWYKTADTLSEQAFKQHLRNWFVNRCWGKSSPISEAQQQEYMAAYKAGREAKLL